MVYRPERGGEPTLIKVCDSINKINTDNVIIMDDFNFRDINWDTNVATSLLSKKFLSCLEDNMLFQLVKEPTRGSNILDLVLTGNPDIVQSVVVGEKLGASDHCKVLIELRIPVPRIALAKRKIYLYSKTDYEAFSKDVKETNWDKELCNKSTDTWNFVKEKYDHWIDKHVPTKTIKTGQRHRPPWSKFKSVKKAKRLKRKAMIKARKTGLNVHHNKF